MVQDSPPRGRESGTVPGGVDAVQAAVAEWIGALVLITFRTWRHGSKQWTTDFVSGQRRSNDMAHSQLAAMLAPSEDELEGVLPMHVPCSRVSDSADVPTPQVAHLP